MNSRLPWLLTACVALLLSPAAFAGPFAVSADRQLKVNWNGQPLVTGDRLDCIGPDAFNVREGSKTTQVNGWTVHNIWQVKDPDKAVTYRREAAVNDHEVELTIQFRVPAYYQEPKDGTNYYRFSVPLKALEGTTFYALCGVPSSPRNLSGTITADMPDGSILNGNFPDGNQTAFIAFAGNGKHLVFDLNPKGPTAFNYYGPTSIQGLWSIEKQGDKLVFSVGRWVQFFGGVFNAKARIIEGTFNDYSKWHAHRSYRYFSEVPTIGKPLEMPAGSGDKSLDVNVPEPGVYFLTVRNNLAATGPFTLACDGQTIARDVSAAAGKMQTLTFSQYVEGKTIKLDWHGNWAASTVAVQALIYKAEDFAFKRGVWLADDIPAPTDMFMYKRSAPPAQAWTNDGQGAQPPSAAQLAAAVVPPGKVNVPNQTDPARDWRWDGNIGTMGPGNWGSFYEFDTDALINRRLGELRKLGYRTIILNGLLIRHDWPEQLPRVEKTMANIVRLAHARGMKVVDHQDLTLLPYRDAGYNELVDHLDWTQRDVRTGVPTRGWCLNNPHFRDQYWSYITDWIKKTDIDGLMVDEATFHGEMFCGCEYCRAKFHHDTGLYLPYSGKDLMNPNSRLWKLWLNWRIKTVGDWWVDLRERVEKVHPGFVLMKYTTDYGLTSSYGSIGFGASLPESARAVDFLGTEIMSRDLWATYRSNFAAREIFNSLHYAFGSPIFGLVYPIGQPVFAYSGWIQNNMRDGVTWAMQGSDAVEKDAARYTDWKQNMDIRHAKPVADVAVLFSLASRNFPRYYGHGYALIGTCEQLGDQHVPYQVILNRDLTPAFLKKFKVLILPSDCCMSDAEIAVVHEYLLDGGKVLSLGHTAALDQLGADRKTWPIGSWIGLKFDYKLAATPVSLSGSAIGGGTMDFPEAIMQVTRDPQSGAKPDVLAEAKAAGQSFIAIAQGNVGKGTLLVVTPRLGRVNCEREATAGNTWEYAYNPAVGGLFTHMVDRLRGDHPDFQAIQIPSAVCVSVYRQPAADGKTMTLVHLYNGTGVHMKKGEKVPSVQPADPFPALSEDLVFELELPRAGHVTGQIVSPDYSETREAKVEAVGDHRYRVTVPKADLIAYDIVRLQ